MARTVAVPGEFTASRPLEVVQIDHTQVDVIVVDAVSRQSTGRPWLTLAIDVHTRMVVGAYLSLDEPSVVSVGVCLLNSVFEKSAFLRSERDSILRGRQWVCQPPFTSTTAPSSAAERSCADARSTAYTWPGGPRALRATVAISSG